MENQNYGSVIGCGSCAPFINSLASAGTTMSNYQAYAQSISGCSAGCYQAFTSGQVLGSDGWCPRASSPCQNASNIASQLSSAGLTSAAFCEDGCPRGADHFPWIGYTNTWNSCLTGSFTCNGSTTPSGMLLYGTTDALGGSTSYSSVQSNAGNSAFINYLNSANPASYIWFTPTDSHNMHDDSIITGDNYLASLLCGCGAGGTISSPNSGTVFSTTLWNAGSTLLYIWWDENSNPPNVLYGSMVKPGYTSANSYDEYNALHTIEANWALPYINSAVASDSSITDIFTTTGSLQLSASFTYLPTTPVTNTPVVFTGVATGGIAPYSYSWNFGDGATATGSTPSHTYTTAGSYTVTLTVTDSATRTVKSSQTINIGSPAPTLTASFSFTPSQPLSDQQVTFTGNGNGGVSPYSYSWSLGDGSTATGQSATHSYSTVGVFTVTLTIKDSESPQQTATTTQTITVTSQTPTLATSLTYAPAQPNVGQVVAFTAAASGGTVPYSFTWRFGDGSTGTGSTITHSYTINGTFTVTLTTTDSSSPQEKANSTATVTVSRPTAASSEPNYTLSWLGYDWDGGNEETLTFNGHFLASLPTSNSPQNGRVYTAFVLNISSLIVPGVNTLVISHANWDCAVSDNVTNLQIALHIDNQTVILYRNPTLEPLTCTQQITYSFTVLYPFTPTAPYMAVVSLVRHDEIGSASYAHTIM